METVKTLLLGGCSATVRTRQGALPYHLACIPEIKAMLESMGGPAAVPNPGDTIDMLQILTELTMPSDFDMGTRLQVYMSVFTVLLNFISSLISFISMSSLWP